MLLRSVSKNIWPKMFLNVSKQQQLKTSQELRIAALRVVGCQGVKVFLLKDVIITTSVTTVIFITSTTY